MEKYSLKLCKIKLRKDLKIFISWKHHLSVHVKSTLYMHTKVYTFFLIYRYITISVYLLCLLSFIARMNNFLIFP